MSVITSKEDSLRSSLKAHKFMCRGAILLFNLVRLLLGIVGAVTVLASLLQIEIPSGIAGMGIITEIVLSASGYKAKLIVRLHEITTLHNELSSMILNRISIESNDNTIDELTYFKQLIQIENRMEGIDGVDLPTLLPT